MDQTNVLELMNDAGRQLGDMKLVVATFCFVKSTPHRNRCAKRGIIAPITIKREKENLEIPSANSALPGKIRLKNVFNELINLRVIRPTMDVQ
tara:strand:+ start:105 stop:383 length:279 start_codon:yes stop_codon:yes gene_type:complete